MPTDPEMTLQQIRELAKKLNSRPRTPYQKPTIDFRELVGRLRGIRAEYIGKLKTDPETQQAVLTMLEVERDKYTDSNKALMQGLVDDLVEAGVYPPLNAELTGERCKLTPMKMVEGWGADWHIYRGLLNCPHCNADLRSSQGPPFKREMGIEVFGLYDGVAYYQCPDCKGAFSRKGTPLTAEQVQTIDRQEIFSL